MSDFIDTQIEVLIQIEKQFQLYDGKHSLRDSFAIRRLKNDILFENKGRWFTAELYGRVTKWHRNKINLYPVAYDILQNSHLFGVARLEAEAKSCGVSNEDYHPKDYKTMRLLSYIMEYCDGDFNSFTLPLWSTTQTAYHDIATYVDTVNKVFVASEYYIGD